FDIGAIEGEDRACDRDTFFDDRGKLQLVTGACFVCGQRPRGCSEGEVIKILHRLFRPRRGGNVQWQYEFALLSSVAEKPRGMKVRRRGIGAFGGGGEPDLRRTVGKGDQVLGADDVLDLLQTILIV